MADTKITALTALTAADPANDVLPIVDVSDTTMAASGTTKKISVNNILGASGTATLASATITGALTVGTGANAAVLKASFLGGYSVFENSAGTGNPSITFNNDLDTGIRAPSANTLVFDAGGFEQYRIASSGVFTWSDGAGGTRMTLNSTGLGVGVSPAVLLDVQSASAVIRATSSTGTNTSFAAFANTGGAVRVGAENSAGGGLFTGSSAYSAVLGTTGAYSAHIGTSGAVRMTVDSSGNVGIGVAPAGTGGCLQLKSGITFPATQVASSDANTLDDYEEGTFTPAITGSTTAGTATYVGRSGKYTKIGNLVQVQIFIDYNSHTGTGDTRITGLPFTNAGNFSAATVGYANGLALTAGNYVQAYVDASQSFILLNQAPTGGGSNTTVPIDPAAILVITATYTV